MKNPMRLWLSTIWFVLALGMVALAAACSGTDAPAAFDPTNGDGGKADAKPASTKDNPPPRPIDEKPPPVTADDAPVPQITSVTPNKATLNGIGPTVTVNGALFVPRSKILLDGVPLTTSFESDSALQATIPNDKLKAVAQLKVTVKTDAPGGGTTSEVVFAVENPKPELTSLAPLSVATGAGATTLTLTGKNFVSGAKVRFGTSDIPSTTKSDTTIEATIPSGLLGASASIPVKVTNPIPGGGVSSELAFTVSNPSSNITSISPASTTVNTNGLTLIVKGTGFVNAVVLFNGVEVATTAAASDQLSATIPAAALTNVGDVPVTVKTPPPGGGVSAAVAFAIVYPKPTITSLSPSKTGAGSNPTEVTVTGTKFFASSVVTFNGVASATTFVDDKHVKATLTVAQLAVAGTIDVKVVNSTPGGGANDGTNTITVENGVPKINAFQPAAVPIVAGGGPDTTVEVIGTGFVAGTTAKARIGAPGAYTNLGYTYVDSSHAKLTIPASLLGEGGKDVTVVLTNPAPGGGPSTGGPKLQVLCDSTGVNVHLNTTTTDTLVPDYANASKLPRWAAGGGTCPVDIFPAEQQPARYVLVQNSTTADLLLTAWGECQGGKGDGFLAFYRSGTEPADDAARKACTGSVSEGAPLLSPEANGSDKCPGLTKGNGALRLAACERAIIQLQSYSFEDAANPPPVNLKVKGETP